MANRGSSGGRERDGDGDGDGDGCPGNEANHFAIHCFMIDASLTALSA